MRIRNVVLLVVCLLALSVMAVACQPEAVQVEVTRVITQIQTSVPEEIEVEIPVEVTRIVTESATRCENSSHPSAFLPRILCNP